MSDKRQLEQLKPIADEMLAGLHAGEKMKMRVREAALAGRPRRKPARVLVPAVCCAALAVVCAVAIGNARIRPDDVARIYTITAGVGGEGDFPSAQGDVLGDGVSVRAAVAGDDSLFAGGEGDMPLVALDGGVYRMLNESVAVDGALRGEAVGEVASFTEEPSLASDDSLRAGLSNVAPEGSAIYAVSGLDAQTAVAAEVDGALRLFQRVSYAGKGPGQRALSEVFAVRGQVASLELSGVGTLSGEAAGSVMDVLFESATLVSADASARKQTLTVTLDNGLKLQLGVFGDTVYGCGAWSCPEFFEAFGAAM